MYLSRKEELEKMLDIIDKIEVNLNYLRQYLKNSESIRLVSKIEKEINLNRDSIKELNNPFLLFIMGNGNYGKSTLINSLLQDNRVNTNDLPNSWKLDIFIRSRYQKVEITYNNNQKIIKSLDEASKILESEEKKYKDSKQKIFNLINKYKINNKVSIKELKEYKTNLEERYLYKSDIIQFKYYLKSDNILNDFIIVDTPGLNQTLLKDTLERMKSYYLKSDGIIWLVDAQNLVSKENSKLLDERKSTLINSLLQDNRVNTNDLPNSWKLDIFIRSRYQKVEITYNNNQKIIKSLDEASKILESEEKKYKDSKQKIFNLINKYKINNKVSIKELKEYKTNLEERYLYKSDIIQFKYYLKSDNILNDFIIVDTPGLNQTLLKDTLERMKSYYLKSDGIIWLVDAQNLVSKENSKLLDEINKIESLSNLSKNKILVINKMDIVRNIDDANVNKVKNKAYDIYKDKFKDIIFISAKEAIDGILNNNYELINQSNIKKLYESIDINFKDVSEQNQIKAKYQNINIMKRNIINEIHSYKRQLYKDMSTYIKIDNELKEKINDFKKDMNNYLENIKKGKYKSDEDIKNLKESILEFEEVCNLNISNLYENIYLKINFNKEHKINEINTKIYFSKNKNLIFKYSTLETKLKTNQLENIFNILISNLIY